MQIILYSTATCPYCKMLKDYLRERGMAFTEKQVDIDEVAKEEMTKFSGGFLGVPFMLIMLDDGRKETVVGFDRGKLDSILNLQG
jgi:glutaredoxin 3